MKEIDFTDKILQYKEEGLLADEKAGYPPNCKPGHELSKDKKKCVPIKQFSDEAKTKEQWDKMSEIPYDCNVHLPSGSYFEMTLYPMTSFGLYMREWHNCPLSELWLLSFLDGPLTTLRTL